MASPFFFEGTTYWSSGDEAAHFEWLGKISCIRAAQGELRRVYLTVDEERLTRSQLREIEAVYRRYGGDLAQLDQLQGIARDDEVEEDA